MIKTAFVVLAMASLPAMVLAANKPSSFVPHPQTHQHVYGSPIGSKVLGHPKTQPRHAQLPKPKQVTPHVTAKPRFTAPSAPRGPAPPLKPRGT